MENSEVAPNSTVRSQDSSNSKNSKRSKNASMSDSKPESWLESKHSRDVLISEKQPRQQQSHTQQYSDDRQNLENFKSRDDSNLPMFTSCGQLLLGVVLVVFGILVLVHGAPLGGSGAGLWAGVAALIAGALGILATVAASSSNTNTSFSTAHLAASLVAVALSNMATITALTAIVRDSQKTPEVTLLSDSNEDGTPTEIDGGWPGLLASIGLLIASIAELLISGYSCLTLTPKLCGCLQANNVDNGVVDSRRKMRNMIHHWVSAQSPVPKSQPIYLVQSMLPLHPMIQAPYAMPRAPAKFPGGYLPAGTLPLATPTYGAVPILPHLPCAARPPSQMIRPKQKRHLYMEHDESLERNIHTENKKEFLKKTSPTETDQIEVAQTYTGLDKKISEEFISIAMDPERKSKASSIHGSEYKNVTQKEGCDKGEKR